MVMRDAADYSSGVFVIALIYILRIGIANSSHRPNVELPPTSKRIKLVKRLQRLRTYREPIILAHARNVAHHQ